MSADLFAEFGAFSQPPRSQQSQDKSKQNHVAASNDPFDLASLSFASPAGQTGQTSAAGPKLQPWPTYQAPAQPSGADLWGDMSSLSRPAAQPQPAAQSTADDDDGWGDFETAEPAAGPAAILTASKPLTKPAAEPSQEPQRRRIIRASTMDLISNNLIDIGISSQPEPSPPLWALNAASRPKPSAPKPAPDPNVLFDADNLDPDDDEDDDDEFGDFETVSAPAPAPAPAPFPTRTPAPVPVQPPSMDLLSLGDITEIVPPKMRPGQLAPLSFGAIDASPYPQAPRSPSFQERNPFPGLSIAPKEVVLKQDDKPNSPSPATVWPSFDEDSTAAKKADVDDEWAAFEDFPPEKPRAAPPSPPPSNWDWDAIESTQPPALSSRDDEPPPINIPPPSVLLSVFPQLLDLANSSLYGPLAGKPATMKQKVMSDPAAIMFLKGYLLLSTVAARVIAGRKLRWNRDKFLAKGMSISAAGSKGMKLAGVDKAQATREDREAADVVAVWKEHVGKLRSAVAAANSVAGTGNSLQQLKVPELGEHMTVKTAKLVPTAPKACIICGLKRDERVLKVDYEVEDSFGEWWAEHWGHRACKNFWLEHEKQLRQR